MAYGLVPLTLRFLTFQRSFLPVDEKFPRARRQEQQESMSGRRASPAYRFDALVRRYFLMSKDDRRIKTSTFKGEPST